MAAFAAAAATLLRVRRCTFRASGKTQVLPPFKPSSIFQDLTSPGKNKYFSALCDALSLRQSTSDRLVVFRRSLCTDPPAPINESGSIDSSFMKSMENKIREKLHAESVTVKEPYGDGRHVRIEVVSSDFEGVNPVFRQTLVFDAIREELENTDHLVYMTSNKTPEEASSRK